MPIGAKISSDIDFDRLLNAVGVPMMILNKNLVFVYANKDYCESVKTTKEKLLGRYVFDAFPDTPERVGPILEKFKLTLAGETTHLTATPFKLEDEDGIIRDHVWQAVQRPYYNSEGEVTHLIQRCDDITERVAIRKQKEIISAELDHRVRNMMAVVQAVATMTGTSSENIDDFIDAFSGRLESMSRNFTQLSRGKWKGLPLKAILEDELSVYVEPKSHRVNMDGPDTVLSIKSTKDAALIIHEMATNAAKYGCFSDKNGRLDIKWWEGDRTLFITWHESGLTNVTEPTKQGFGYSFLELMPNMKVTKAFNPTGLKIDFEIPVQIAVDGIAIA